jgi:hypothetical protein
MEQRDGDDFFGRMPEPMRLARAINIELFEPFLSDWHGFRWYF